MAQVVEWSFKGYRGRRVARTWQAAEPRYIALLAHGYGEHLGRYEYVAQTITVDGGTVYAVDHVGHGKSEGQRVLIDDFERVVDDFHLLAERAQKELPGLPMVLIGHSMGGLIAARYAQRYGGELAALVLSGPVLGRWATVSTLLAADVIPDTPIDPATLSRDPEVGRAYVADLLVWHGKFERTTLEALDTTLQVVNESGDLGELPTLWMHGQEDHLVPIADTRGGIERIRGSKFQQQVFPGARHEVFNEVNRNEVLAVVTHFIDAVLAR